MSRIAVCGLVNTETTVNIDSFPIEYRPIDYRFFGIDSAPSGVGLNVSLALNKLGDEVRLLSLCGEDMSGAAVRSTLKSNFLSDEFLLSKCKSTAQSVVLYDSYGKRFVLCDLTDNQEIEYDKEKFAEATEGCDLLCLCNINFAAGLISKAKEKNIKIATDVHCLSNVRDEYNSRFLEAADIVFLSNEAIIGREKEFSLELMEEYSPEIVVVGMGEKGALLRTRCDGEPMLVPAVCVRKVVNTVGAGDSLYSAFLHFYIKSFDALDSLKKAVYFASYKIGESGAAKGFLTEEELIKLMGE